MDFFVQFIKIQDSMSWFEVKAWFMIPHCSLSRRKMIIINKDSDSQLILTNFLFTCATCTSSWFCIFNAYILNWVSDTIIFKHHNYFELIFYKCEIKFLILLYLLILKFWLKLIKFYRNKKTCWFLSEYTPNIIFFYKKLNGFIKYQILHADDDSIQGYLLTSSN